MRTKGKARPKTVPRRSNEWRCYPWLRSGPPPPSGHAVGDFDPSAMPAAARTADGPVSPVLHTLEATRGKFELGSIVMYDRAEHIVIGQIEGRKHCGPALIVDRSRETHSHRTCHHDIGATCAGAKRRQDLLRPAQRALSALCPECDRPTGRRRGPAGARRLLEGKRRDSHSGAGEETARRQDNAAGGGEFKP